MAQNASQAAVYAKGLKHAAYCTSNCFNVNVTALSPLHVKHAAYCTSTCFNVNEALNFAQAVYV
jgi:hypothetical protein